MIAYFIQLHGELHYFEWMLPLIWHGQNVYVVSVDADDATFAQVTAFCARFDNVKVIRSVPVVWGGSTVVTSILRGLAVALGFGDWEYFINISGRDLPLLSQAGMIDRLRQAARDGQRNFIQYFGGVWVSWLDADPAATAVATVKPSNRFPALIATDAMLDVLHGEESPIMKWTIRPNYRCTENALTKTLQIRGLAEAELAVRKAIFSERLSFRAGRQWFVFSRSLCEWISTADTTIEYMDYFRTILIPDESFFQSLLERAPQRERETIAQTNLRLRDGDPVWLNDTALAEVQKSPAFFGRKLQWDSSEQLRAYVESHVR